MQFKQQLQFLLFLVFIFMNSVKTSAQSAPVPPSNDSICLDSTTTFVAQSDTGVVVWINSSGTILDTGLTYTTTISESVTYYLYNDVNGVTSDTVSFQVIAKDCTGPIFPNVFTPNGDGVNDYFYITIPYATCFSMEIYNRWGIEVFNATTVEYPWDGRVPSSGEQLPAGVYYYTISYCLTGGVKETKKGSVTILR